jgi:hypothetical protein
MGYDMTDRTAQFSAEESTGTELTDGFNSNDLEDNLSVPGGFGGIIGNARGTVKSGDRHFRKAYAADNAWDIRGLTSCTWAAWYYITNAKQHHLFSIDDAAGANAEGQALILVPRETNTPPEGPWCFMGGGVTRWVGASLKIATATVTLNSWQFFACGFDAQRVKLFGAWGRSAGEFYYNETDGLAGGFGYDGTNTETMIGKFNGEAGIAESYVAHGIWFNGRALKESDLRILWNDHAALPFDQLRGGDDEDFITHRKLVHRR